jgi:hypothetical protein
MQRERRFPTGLFCAALVALGVCDQPRQLAAQGIQIQFGGPRARTPNNGDGSDGLSMFVADRTVMQRLSRAQEAINGKEYPDAVRHLQAVLDHPEDFFYRPDKTKPT